jgi:hypothetical protein
VVRFLADSAALVKGNMTAFTGLTSEGKRFRNGACTLSDKMVLWCKTEFLGALLDCCPAEL